MRKAPLTASANNSAAQDESDFFFLFSFRLLFFFFCPFLLFSRSRRANDCSERAAKRFAGVNASETVLPKACGASGLGRETKERKSPPTSSFAGFAHIPVMGTAVAMTRPNQRGKLFERILRFFVCGALIGPIGRISPCEAPTTRSTS